MRQQYFLLDTATFIDKLRRSNGCSEGAGEDKRYGVSMSSFGPQSRRGNSRPKRRSHNSSSRRAASSDEEKFLAGTAVRVYPVGKIEDRVIEKTPGPLTRKLAALIGEITSGHNEQFSSWMF